MLAKLGGLFAVKPRGKSGGKQGGDIVLTLVVFALIAVGLLFVYSASNYSAEQTYGNKYYFVAKQAVGAAVGIAAFFLCANISLAFVKKLWIVGVAVSAVLLGLVFVPGIGIENYGAKRWIGFGGFSLQPSEIAKFAYVLFCSVYMTRFDMTKLRYAVVPLAVGGALCLLIITEPNMSVTVCVAAVMVVMLFLGGVKWRYFLLMSLPLVVAAPVLILIEPYRVQRLLAFLDPWASPKGEGYQLIQSLYALGSGGWFGVGLFNSRQKYRFLPFAESDFVFSVIGEETGLFGCLVVFVLFVVLILRGVRIAVNSKGKFEFFLASGITAVIAVQTLVNFAVVTGSIPPTGLPLPFISYGGTSLVVFMSAAGLLVNLSKNSFSQGANNWIT